MFRSVVCMCAMEMELCLPVRKYSQRPSIAEAMHKYKVNVKSQGCFYIKTLQLFQMGHLVFL